MKVLSFLFAILISGATLAQGMNNERLETLLTKQVDSIEGSAGRWQLSFNELPMIVLTDETNDRMRIMAPIIEVSRLDKDLLLDCLTANYHSALDVKYAIANDLLWSVYIHPLSPLTEKELSSAVEQVFLAAATFGTTFSSTPLLFGGNQDKGEEKKEKTVTRLKKT